MKKLLVWCLVLTMVISTVVFPVSAFATETTEDTTTGDTTTDGTETETTTPQEVVYFDIDFDKCDLTSTVTAFTSVATAKSGTWSDAKAKGHVIDGYDGKAFTFTTTRTSSYSTFTPTDNITTETGKVLMSMDVSMKVGTSASAVWTWMGAGNGWSFYPVRIGTYGLKTTNTKHTAEDLLVSPDGSDVPTTVDIVMDVKNKTKAYYVNGKEVTDATKTFTLGTMPSTKLKLYLNDNIHSLDNFKMVLNPSSQFSFAQKGEVTSESEYVTVRFSDTVVPTASDFVIANTEGTEVATVTDVEQVNGKFYNLKLSNKLEPGSYNLTLKNTALTSVIAGSTSSNTTSAFTVLPEYTYFDIDFEYAGENFGIQSYLDNYENYGTWNFVGGAEIQQTKLNGYSGDDSTGVYASDEVSTTVRNVGYTLNTPITGGKVIISFDGAFDSTINPNRTQLMYLNNDANNGNLLTYGTGTGDDTNTSVIAGTKTDMHYSGGTTFTYEDNKTYRWDTVIDIEGKTITNYCDGVAFNTQSIAKAETATTTTAELESIESLVFRFTPSVTFFDNFKVTHNVDDFGYTASDIGTYSNSTIINFDDTMVFDDVSTAMVFADPYGNIVTPTSVTKISPRKYKAAFSAVDLIAGEYKVTLADGITTSAIGNTVNVESASFTVAERPEDTFFAKNLDFAEVEGGVSLSTTLTNWGEDTENPEEALLVIAVYDGNELVECVADSFDIASGDTDIEKSITLTTAKDLSQYTVRGFVWDIGEEFYSLYEPATK